MPRGVSVDKSIWVSLSAIYSCSRVFYSMIFYFIFWLDIYCISVKNCILVDVSCYPAVVNFLSGNILL